MMITRTVGWLSLSLPSSASPDSPGIRISVTMTCGSPCCKRLGDLVDRRERLVRDALARKRLFEHPANGAVVVDDPDRIHRLTLGKIAIVIRMHRLYPESRRALPVELQRQQDR